MMFNETLLQLLHLINEFKMLLIRLFCTIFTKIYNAAAKYIYSIYT